MIGNLQNRPASSTKLPNRPSTQGTEIEQAKEAVEDSFLYTVSKKTIGAAVGAGSALTAAVVYGCAGAAEGFVHGAKIPAAKREYLRTGVMTGNMLAVGALGGLGGSAVAVATGLKIWGETSHQTKADVAVKADSWTDTVNGWVDKVWSDPGATDPIKSNSRRAVGGALGEVAGGGAGFLVGLTKAFGPGQEAGEKFVESLAKLSH